MKKYGKLKESKPSLFLHTKMLRALPALTFAAGIVSFPVIAKEKISEEIINIEKCLKCKPKGTLELLDNQIAANKSKRSETNDSQTQEGYNGENERGSSYQQSQQSGIEKGNDRQNDLGTED